MSATSPVLDASIWKTRSWFAAMVDASASSVPVTMERFIIWEMASFTVLEVGMHAEDIVSTCGSIPALMGGEAIIKLVAST